MKFGQQLRSSLIKEYSSHYIAYHDLKKRLKTPYETPPTGENPHPKRRPWTEEDERKFVAALEGELDRVFNFQRVKSAGIVRRIKTAEREVNEVIAKLDQTGLRRTDLDDGAGTDGPTEVDFLLLEQDLSEIIADVHDLAQFTQLNYTGFQKIIKKHDKHASWGLKPLFAARLRAKPFFKDNYDGFIVTLSRLYDLVRTRGNPIKGDSAAGGSQQNFLRTTTKYWVHASNVTELKLIILKHLPVLVFNAAKEFDPKDSAITSIYYDNPETWELYTGRLKKTEGAEAIRLRWYGGMDTQTIFLERKTHREDWTGEKSVKARFSMKEKNVNAFLEGRLTVEQVFEKMWQDGKKGQKEIANLEQLAREIQYSVLTRQLKPVTRTFYNRTAFQLPGDARVRISLDTELTMIREDNLDGRTRAGRNWRRTDIGIDYPFSQLPPEDIERFPYAVLEVKLQTQAGQDIPTWVKELTSSHLVEAVPKFSKFIHGTAALFPNRIDLLPFWMPQMQTDIRKPVTHYFGITRPGHSESTTDGTIDDESDEDGSDGDSPGVVQTPRVGQATDEDEGHRRLREAQAAIDQNRRERASDYPEAANALDVEERIAALPRENTDDYPIYDSEDDGDDDVTDDSNVAQRSSRWRHRLRILRRGAQRISNHLVIGLESLIPYPRPSELSADMRPMRDILGPEPQAKRFKAPKGKRIFVPMRVEPKVYFAAERTFLSWLEFSVIIGSIAAVLVNFGDDLSLLSAWAFTILACLALVYSLMLYLWRVDNIRKRRAGRFHDGYGPTALCVGLFTALAVNFMFRIRGDGWV